MLLEIDQKGKDENLKQTLMSGIARVGEENGICSLSPLHHLFSLFFLIPFRNGDLDAVSFPAGLSGTFLYLCSRWGNQIAVLWLSVE